MPTPTTYIPKQLATPAQLSNVAATLYTVPGATTTKLTSLILVNTEAGVAHTVSIHLGTAAASNALCYNFTIPSDGLPYEIIPAGSEIYLPAASIIQGVADVASKVTYIISGVELS